MAQAAKTVSEVSLRSIRFYACKTLNLKRYFQCPGDGRMRPALPASVLVWAQVAGYLLRECSYHAMEALARSGTGRILGMARRFGDDALAYFTERLDPQQTRQALAGVVARAKRNKVFEAHRYIGLAVDGTGAGRCATMRCPLCRPYFNTEREVAGYNHAVAAISVVGCGIPLPFDVEPYGPGDSEYNAGQRLLRRAVEHLGRRFADYVTVDGEYATAPFLHTATELGLYVVARLKDNLPDLMTQARERFEGVAPAHCFQCGKDHIECWDADDFDPWETLNWKTVRVLRYRQSKPDGTIVEAYWLTNFPSSCASAQALYGFAKARWEIENQGFNDAKNRYGFEHIPHHHPNSLLLHWLLVFLALCIERLYRLRYLHRGNHPCISAITLLRRLRLAIAKPALINSG